MHVLQILRLRLKTREKGLKETTIRNNCQFQDCVFCGHGQFSGYGSGRIRIILADPYPIWHPGAGDPDPYPYDTSFLTLKEKYVYPLRDTSPKISQSSSKMNTGKLIM